MKTKNLGMYIFAAIVVGIAIFLGGFFYRSPSNISKEGVPARPEEAVTENNMYGHVHSLFRNPNDGAILMGTHHGLFKSTDEGETFVKVETKTEAAAEDFMNFAYDKNSSILYAGGHDVGIVKSADGGSTWFKTDSGVKGADIHALAINPLDPNSLYAFSVDSGVFGTKDGAKSWYRIDDGPVNPSVRAFGYMATPSSMDRNMRTDKTTNIGYLWAGTGGGLYSSFVCFCGWTKNEGIPDNATIYTLTPDPANPSRMLVGTKDGIFRTTDEGKTFAKINTDIQDVAAIAFDLSNPQVVFSATTNGILYKSMDTGETWSEI